MFNFYFYFLPIAGVVLAYVFRNLGLFQFQFLALFGVYLFYLCHSSIFFKKFKEAQIILTGLLSFTCLVFSFLFAAYHQIPEHLLAVQKVILFAEVFTFSASMLSDDDDDNDGGTFQRIWDFFDFVFPGQIRQPEKVYIRVSDF
jgi:hypothetical protein